MKLSKFSFSGTFKKSHRISSKIGRPSKISRFENKPRYFSRRKKNRPTSKISRDAVKSLHCTPNLKSFRVLMKLSPDEIDYEQLKREGSKGSVCVENEADAWEENRNEIVIDDLLDILEEDIGIVLQN